MDRGSGHPRREESGERKARVSGDDRAENGESGAGQEPDELCRQLVPVVKQHGAAVNYDTTGSLLINDWLSHAVMVAVRV